MPRDSVTVDIAFEMADQVIAFLSGAEEKEDTAVTATQSDGGTTSTGPILQSQVGTSK